MEVVAAVASIGGLASLGIQLMECASKLANFYGQVEKAPRTLKRISHGLRMFAMLLKRIEGISACHDGEDAATLAEFIELCKEAAQEIVEITDKLQSIMQKNHAFGRVLSAFKLLEVNQLCTELEHWKSSLVLAFDVLKYETQAQIMGATHDTTLQIRLLLTRRDHQDGATLTGSSKTVQAGSAVQQAADTGDRVVEIGEYGEALPLHPHRRRPRRRQAKTRSFRIPSWFSNRVWHLSVAHSQGRWEVNLQTWNYLPESSPALTYVESGDAESLRRMLQAGLASPYDVYGRLTMIQVGVS
ncbi:uncharacterized protein LTR77_002331 [Saxophila tyrrhenica]|uniref:Fungal N-terminal domain-containing protein n=1 Tax=Saxophila tyrrhenica TaxID=1690608 RepID=A0AAV9PLC3_9PEZI|nr:hypothetical protein LTR77_002331 [Saxophila tyrrhenica]